MQTRVFQQTQALALKIPAQVLALPVYAERRQDQPSDPNNHQKHERVAAMLVRVKNDMAALIRRDPNYQKYEEG